MTDAARNPDAERAHQLMMGALDGELDHAEQAELDGLLAATPALQAEWERLKQVKEVTSTMTLRSPPEEVWESYWTSVYHRLERGVGWILASIGAIVLLAYGLWTAAQELMADASIPGFIKAAVFATLLGTAIILVSVAREKWFVYRSDPYKDVKR
jgi:ferric-dicitrate binding protein FerR (iron transport regulator)